MPLSIDQYRHIFVLDNPLLKSEVFEKLQERASATQVPFEQQLIEEAFITTQQYLELLAAFFNVPAAQLRYGEVDSQALTTLPEQLASESLAVAFSTQDGQFCVAVADPSNHEVIQRIEQTIGNNVKIFVSTEAAIRRTLVLYDGDFLTRMQAAVMQYNGRLQQSADADAAKQAVEPLIDIMFETAVYMGASDVHIENYQTEITIRFRVDGRLRTIASVPKDLGEIIIAQIKNRANMEVQRGRTPQDGRFTLNEKAQLVNVRLASIPAFWGDKLVLRLLPRDSQFVGMAELGLLDVDLRTIQKHLREPHGMILVTGPTNSGKSTSLYAFLQQIVLTKTGELSVSTIEDPVEYTMPGVTQVQVNTELSFAVGLRSLLRQDPDVVMVGEIRDQETAEIAIRTALAGRLMLSTLHTNDAPGTAVRLLDLGIEPYLVASTLSIVVAQRLVRRLCVHCRQAYRPDATTLQQLTQNHGLEHVLEQLQASGVLHDFNPADMQFYKAAGCQVCASTGYQGRIVLFEIMEATKALREGIYEHVGSDQLNQLALQQGMKSMFADGFAKLLEGLIDLDELFTATAE